MTITSKFYTGPVNNVDWAEGTALLGYRYAVGGTSDFIVTKNASAVRGVSIASGEAGGGGIYDVSDATEPLELPYNAANRWHLVGLNRVWATEETTPDSIEGTAVQQIPTRPNVRGVEDFHPLALCYVAGDSAEVSQIIDLRVIAYNGGVLVANSDLVRSFMNRVGTQIRIIDSNGWVLEWTRIIVGGSASWVSRDTNWDRIDYPLPESTGADAVLSSTIRWAPKDSSRMVRQGFWRNAHLVFDRLTSSFQFADGAGRLDPVYVLGVLHPHDRPASRVTCSASIYTTAGALFDCTVSIEAVTGEVTLTAGPPNGTIGPQGPTNTITIDATYVRP
jgi:hypothetical protein